MSPLKNPSSRLGDGLDLSKVGMNAQLVGVAVGIVSITLFALYYLILENWAMNSLEAGSYDEYWDRKDMANDILLGAWITFIIALTLIADGVVVKFRSWKRPSLIVFRRNALMIGFIAGVICVASFAIIPALTDETWETSAERETRLAVTNLTAILGVMALAVTIACVVNVSLAYLSCAEQGETDQRPPLA